MKLLFLTQEFPYPTLTGGRVRTYNLLRHLARNHSISLLSFCRGTPAPDDIRKLQECCTHVSIVHDAGWSGHASRFGSLVLMSPRAVRYYNQKRYRLELEKMLARTNYDLLQSETSYLAGHILQLPDKMKKIVVFLDLNVLLSLRRFLHSTDPAKKLGYLVETVQFLRWERQVARKADAAVTVSDRERDVLAMISPGSTIRVIPNGVDTSLLKPEPIKTVKKSLIFVGSHEHTPNLDAGLYFLKRILPRIRRKIPGIKTFLVGLGGHPRIRSCLDENVIAVEPTRDVSRYYGLADFAIAPVRIGAGTRLKILEAMALGLPVISTSRGCEGLEIKDGMHLLVRNRPSAFAAAVIELYQRPGLVKELRETARELVERRYDWATISRDLEEVYQTVAKSGAQ